MDRLDHDEGHTSSYRPSEASQHPFTVQTDELHTLSAATHYAPKGSKSAGGPARVQDRASCYRAATNGTRLGEAQTTALSLNSHTTNTPLELRLQAVESRIKYLESLLGQNEYISFGLLRQHLPNLTQATEALSNSASPAAFNALGSAPPNGQADLQAGVLASLEDGSSTIAQFQHNNPVDVNGPDPSSAIADNSSNGYFDMGVSAEQLFDNSSAIIQDWNASPMINNEPDNGNFLDPMYYFVAASNSNQADVDLTGGTVSQMISNPIDSSFSGVQSFDTIDTTATYTAYGTGANVDRNLPDANYGDAHSLAPVVAPSNAASTSSANQGSTSRPRLYRCGLPMNCHKTFARRADRDRHNLTHDRTSIRTFSCPFAGCNKVGANGFWREDKFNEHQVRMGH